jgi:hypothetical protein
MSEFHRIVTHHVRTKFWKKKKKVLECQAFLIIHRWTRDVQKNEIKRF